MRSAGGFTGGRFVLPSSTPLRPGDARYFVTGTRGGHIRGSGERDRPDAQVCVTTGGTVLVSRGETDAPSKCAATPDTAEPSAPTETTRPTNVERFICSPGTTEPPLRVHARTRPTSHRCLRQCSGMSHDVAGLPRMASVKYREAVARVPDAEAPAACDRVSRTQAATVKGRA